MSNNNITFCKKSIIDALSEHALEQPDRKAFIFLDDKIETIDSYTFLELENASSGLAQYLLNKCNLKENDRVLLVFLPDLSFVVSILACFKAGLVAVPVYPPDPTRGESKNSRHFMTIQNISEAKAALTHNNFNNFLSVGSFKNFFTWSSESNKISSLNWINVDKVIAESKVSTAKVVPANYKTPIDKIAFLQFTSGSTSDPKGVMVTYGNIEHNTFLNGEYMMSDKSATGFMWLPHYHDMGLVGGYLGGTQKGSTLYVMSPLTFLKDPTTWVRGLSKYKCNFTAAPNFAMSLSVRKFKEIEKTSDFSLDLSCVKTVILGAEPIDASAILEFTKYFESAGLKSQALSPVFGLAEHTLGAIAGGESIVYIDKKALLENQVIIKETISRFSQESSSVIVDCDTHPLVSCGIVERTDCDLQLDLVIVDPESLELLEDGKIGEIWISSASKALGYYKNPEATEEVFHAKLKGPAASTYKNKTFLRTGDLAFVYCNEMYFCGRIKDLIIFQGVNYYPTDIERTTEKCHASIRPGCSAAFSVKLDSEDTESLVIFAEVRGGVKSLAYPNIIETIVNSVSREQGIYASTICLLKERTIIKTSSGKVARAWNRKAFLEGNNNKELNIVSRWNNSDAEVQSNPNEKRKALTYEEIESIIVDIVRQALRNPQADVSVDTNMLEIGLVSQDIPVIASKMSTELGYKFHPQFVLLYPTIKDVANHAFSSLNDTGKTTTGFKQKEVFLEEVDDLTIHPYEGHLAGYGTSFPVPVSTEVYLKKQEEVRRKLGQSEETIEYFKSVVKSSQIKTRHYCNQTFLKEGQSIDGIVGVVKESIFDDNLDAPYHKRMNVFRETCVELCIDAARKAVDNWGKDRKSISHILTTCTSGFEEPGIACGIIDQLNLSEDIQKAELNFNGCFCGATCLRIARDFIRSGQSQAVLVVACEVASTHMDFKSMEKQHLVSQSLFADGAAAFIVAREGTWRFTKTGSSVIPQTKHLLGLKPPTKEGENSYYMTLSPNVASSLGVYFSKGHGKDLLKKMYNPNIQLPALAVHPGGPRILEAMGLVFKDLGFKDDALKSSYDTFANNGNLGSAAMLLVLAERLSKNNIEEDRLLSMAFGPGVTVEWATYIRSSSDRRGKKGENNSPLFYVTMIALVVAVLLNVVLAAVLLKQF